MLLLFEHMLLHLCWALGVSTTYNDKDSCIIDERSRFKSQYGLPISS